MGGRKKNLVIDYVTNLAFFLCKFTNGVTAFSGQVVKLLLQTLDLLLSKTQIIPVKPAKQSHTLWNSYAQHNKTKITACDIQCCLYIAAFKPRRKAMQGVTVNLLLNKLAKDHTGKYWPSVCFFFYTDLMVLGLYCQDFWLILFQYSTHTW